MMLRTQDAQAVTSVSSKKVVMPGVARMRANASSALDGSEFRSVGMKVLIKIKHDGQVSRDGGANDGIQGSLLCFTCSSH
ncbi:MAG: hypothetical protein CMM46_04920 [Rhodospirillaceae bacterium]|nr:hypothetical protein [Rhodospirillaceae bacterium]